MDTTLSVLFSTHVFAMFGFKRVVPGFIERNKMAPLATATYTFPAVGHRPNVQDEMMFDHRGSIRSFKL